MSLHVAADSPALRYNSLPAPTRQFQRALRGFHSYRV